MIISVHLRKCAGTSFKLALQDYYGSRILMDYGDEIGSFEPSSERKRFISKVRAMQQAQQILGGYDIIHGHFYATKYDFLGADHDYITVLRNPVDRVISNYNYLVRNPQRQHPDALLVHRDKLSLEEYAAHPFARNLQSLFLDGTNIQSYAFVGLTEEYDETIRQMNARFGLELKAGHHENAAKEKAEISDKTRDHIRACNDADCRLYDLGLEIFEKQRSL